MDKEYPVPLYYRIYADLKEKIAEGVSNPVTEYLPRRSCAKFTG